MSDKVFFPLILLLAVLMAGYTLRDESSCAPTGPVGGADTDYNRIIIDSCNLKRITPGVATQTRLIENTEANYLEISSADADTVSNPEEGTHYRLAADIETQFAGHVIRVTITARQPRQQGAQSFEVNYSAGKAGQSGWRRFDLGQDWQDFSFETRVPRAFGHGVDYLGIRPMSSEGRTSMEVRKIVLDRIRKWDTEGGA